MNEEITAKQKLDNIHNEIENVADNTVAQWREKLGAAETKTVDSQDAPKTILDACETIVNNKPHNKYIFSIVITACLKKITSPNQDIRIAQDNMSGGYSNRSFDQRIITPFLKRHGYTHCEASGLESGRNLERPIPWKLDYPCNPRGQNNRESFLGVLHYVQEEGGDAETVIKYLLFFDKSKMSSQESAVVPPREYQISKIMRIFTRHFDESSGQGKSRLPVLALYAIYQELVSQLSRYQGMQLLPLERHTTADLRSGSIGDIQVNKSDEPFEGVEVKSEKPITATMVNELKRKLQDKPASRYYILSTSNPQVLPDDEESVDRAIEITESHTGCQVIVNGLIRTLWYYLRLLEDPSVVLTNYQELLETDGDVQQALRDKWNEIVSKEYNF